ncbi:hypothetical protein [Modestobacter sp. SSW1-42]|uniref:hypothetical protein n=1 Tax=Modestobacter sp. SSW1-42 TaxID=596372 RepID=UPI0039864985
MTTHRAPRATRRTVRTGSTAAVVAGLVLSGCLVWTTSYAAFTAETRNPGNSWTTGHVQLSNDRGTALFQVDRLWPGATGSRCVTVTSGSSVPGEVRLYGAGLTGQTLLTQVVSLDVVQGTAGAAADCSDFVAAATPPVSSRTLAAYPTDYGTGQSPWVLTGTTGEARAYKVTYRVDPNAGNATQDQTAAMTLVWEVQSTTP